MGARRIKKICRWHIFSQSGEKAVLSTWAGGLLRKQVRGQIQTTIFYKIPIDRCVCTTWHRIKSFWACSDRRGRRSLQFCKNTPFEHAVKPYVIELKVFGSTFFQKGGRGLGRCPIKPSNASTAVFALHGIDTKSFLPLFFKKEGGGWGSAP